MEKNIEINKIKLEEDLEKNEISLKSERNYLSENTKDILLSWARGIILSIFSLACISFIIYGITDLKTSEMAGIEGFIARGFGWIVIIIAIIFAIGFAVPAIKGFINIKYLKRSEGVIYAEIEKLEDDNEKLLENFEKEKNNIINKIKDEKSNVPKLERKLKDCNEYISLDIDKLCRVFYADMCGKIGIKKEANKDILNLKKQTMGEE